MSQLFKSFGRDKISGHSQLKSSVQRSIRGQCVFIKSCCLSRFRNILCKTRAINVSFKIIYIVLFNIVGQIAEQYPWLVENGVLEVLLPKKSDLTLIKLCVE
jgi:hypothetical protein